MPRFIALLIISCLFLTGCSSARYVSRDQERGVIAIPSTATWPVDHREKAMELMQSHFPQGYIIEKEEEVVIGTETQNHTDVHAHEIGNSNVFLGGKQPIPRLLIRQNGESPIAELMVRHNHE